MLSNFANTNDVNTDYWFQLYLSNANNIYRIISFQVIISIGLYVCSKLYGSK